MKKALSIIVLLISLIFFPNGTLAQTPVFAPPGVEDQLSVSITPENPGPNTDVTIFVQSFSTNLNKAYITWKVNGVTKEEGAGRSTLTFQTGGAGSKTSVTVLIQGEDGRIINKTFNFEPVEVTLVPEAITYTPPFYKGKPLYVPQATLKVVAFPEFILSNGSKIAPENLVYTWRRDGKVLQSDSGFGKQILLIEGSVIPRPMDISVEVSSVGSSLKGNALITVTPEEPEILFYEESLVYGPLWNRAIKDSLFLTAPEIGLRAEPYFLSAWNAKDPSLVYTWRLNNNPVAQASNENTLGLRNENNEEGTARIGLTIDRTDKILQSIQTNLFINFTNPR